MCIRRYWMKIIKIIAFYYIDTNSEDSGYTIAFYAMQCNAKA